MNQNLNLTIDALYEKKFRPHYELNNLNKCVEMLDKNEELQKRISEREKDVLFNYTLSETAKLYGEDYGRVK